jgi:parallel beta-helix repeat protein
MYYVSPTGKDTSAGTSAAPWLTLQHACDTVVAGDTVTVEAGTYNGFAAGWNLTNAGTASKPITFVAQAGVTINHANPYTADAIDLEPGEDYWIINGFNVTNDGSVTRAGIRATSTHTTIEYNTVTGAGTWGIFTSHDDSVLVKYNTAANSQSQHGIYISNACDNPTVINNTVYGNAECGIQFNGDLSQGGDGLITGALIANNIIHDNGTSGGAGINCDGVQSSTIENNLIYNEHSTGITLFKIDGAAGSTNNIVVNNTVLIASDGRWDLNINTSSTGNVAYNNIFYNYNSSHGSIEIDSGSLTGFKSDYNVTMNKFSADLGNTSLTLSKWQSQTGQDKHSFTSTDTALFVSPSSNNYDLASTSPAIDKGTATDAPATDLEGAARDSTEDMGCYEHDGTSSHAAGAARPTAVGAGAAHPTAVDAALADEGWIAGLLAGVKQHDRSVG